MTTDKDVYLTGVTIMTNTTEIDVNEYRVIRGFPNYKINCEGRIRQYDGVQFKKEVYLVKHSNGFYYANLEYDDTFILKPVVQLVAVAFVPKTTKANIFVIQLDGNTSNHHASNLRWSVYPRFYRNNLE